MQEHYEFGAKRQASSQVEEIGRVKLFARRLTSFYREMNRINQYRCPCNRCKGEKYKSRRFVENHLDAYGRFDDIAFPAEQELEPNNLVELEGILPELGNGKRKRNMSFFSYTTFFWLTGFHFSPCERSIP